MSIPKFTFKVVTLTTALLLLMYFLFPRTWQLEVSTGWWLLLILPPMLYISDLGLTLFQWGFHRWVLHSTGAVEWFFNRPGLRWLYKELVSFHASHELHHKKTKIRTKEYGIDPGTGRMLLFVSSTYAMEEPEQFESSSFPPWSLPRFWEALLPIFIIFRLLLPHLPLAIVIVGVVIIAFGYWRYETTHSIHHYSYEDWWKPRMEHPRWGKYYRRAFVHHNLHHYLRKANMGVDNDHWDEWFNTRHTSTGLMLDQHYVTADDVAYHLPIPIIVYIDARVERQEELCRQRLRAQRVA